MINIVITEIRIINDFETGKPSSRHAEIEITNNGATYAWRVGGIPLTGDVQAYLNGMSESLWRDAFERGEIPQQYVSYFKPVKAPDFIVESPKINADPEKALDEAIAELEKGEGNPKSIALIALSLTKYLQSKKSKLK